MTLLVVQHAADCGPAHLGRWLIEAGVELEVVCAHTGDPLPATLHAHDGLLVLGGDMGAYDDEVAPWLPQTRRLLVEAVERDLPTLAICLGHQLLAVAAGGRVERAAPGQQLGVLPLGLSEAGAADALLGPAGPRARAIHWNDDLVAELPAGAVELARTPAGTQAMRLGTQVWGVQFHPEIGAAEVRAWAHSEPLGAGVPPERLTEMAAAEPELHRTWRSFTERFARAVDDQRRARVSK